MDNYTSYEQAYKNGYAAGFKAAKDESKAHVLSVEELRNAECVYLEAPYEWPSKDGYWALMCCCTENDVFFLFFGDFESVCYRFSDYGKTWRVWSDKPPRKVKVSQEWQK